MADYAIRCERDDRNEMRRLLKKLDVIDVIQPGDVVVVPGGAWDEIGTIPDWRTANAQGQGPVLRGPGGLPYWHYNLRTPINLRKRIRNRAGDPDIDLLATQLGKFFAKIVNTNNDPEDLTPATQPRRIYL
jgi:hypothetical protein